MNKIVLISAIVFFVFSAYSQQDPSVLITFDFNEHQIKEKNDRVIPRFEGIGLVADRFGNEKSAVHIHGNVSSYLNLGTSPLLKPVNGTISLWVNLDRRLYSGKGYDSNPIICTKNGPGDDFIIAYCMAYDAYNNKLMACSTKDSLEEALVASENDFVFGKWHHLVLTFDSKLMALYVDGELQQKMRKGFTTKYLLSDSVMLGHSASIKNARFAIGSFDDIRIYHKVLSENEIYELYNAPNPNKFKNFVSQTLKYLIIILLLVGVIIILIIRNKRNLKKQKEQFELINRITELELKVVKAQMNPHFISNCLAAIQELIFTNDVDNAGQYIAKFSYFLRQVLNYSNKNFITLAQEIDIINLNVELEELRFKNNFIFELTVDNSIDPLEVLVPALITQPFIENAIWHGLLLLTNDRKPELKINIYRDDGLPVIEVIDNGVGRELNKMANEDSIGTKLIIDKVESLNKLYKTANYKVQIIDLFDDNRKQCGTKIRIQLDDVKE